MRHFKEGRFRREVRFLQQQFLQDGNLPFSDVLSSELIEQALTALQVGWVDCIYTPLVTLRVFLGQVLTRKLGDVVKAHDGHQSEWAAHRSALPRCTLDSPMPPDSASGCGTGLGIRDARLSPDRRWRRSAIPH